MSIRVVLFDLDGTLLPMDQDVFVSAYFRLLAKHMAPYGFAPEKLIETIWRGTKAMIQNSGEKSNEAAFWELFASVFGPDALASQPQFAAFYETQFQQIQSVCGFSKEAEHVVRTLKDSGYRLVLATNPIFPAIATQSRIRWAGLSPDDFELYTTYENSSFCKPNPDYYREILKKINASPEECLMVGNDACEDMIARELGMQVFLVTDCLINKEGRDLSSYPSGTLSDLLAFLSYPAFHCKSTGIPC